MNFSKNIFTEFAAILIATLVGIGAVQAQENVLEVVKNSDNHTVFVELLEETELDKLLKEEGPYTVLAPTDQAFEKMDKDLETLKEDPKQLKNVVIGHLFNGEVAAADIEQKKSVNVTKGDIEAENGTVHIIDEVLMD